MSRETWILLIFIVYMAFMVGVGLVFYRKNKGIEDYILGGRSLNPWVAALSAQASDMSGWLLTGLPGLAYLSLAGCKEAAWTAIGLAVGTYLNWLFVAKRLRNYTEVSNNSITLPDYFENRFRDHSKILRVITAVVILVFFLIYTSSMFVAGATLFSSVFGLDYKVALVVGAAIIVAYTFSGGFMAVSWTDFFQGMLMFFALLIVPIIALFALNNPAEALQKTGFTLSSLLPSMDGVTGTGWMLIISSLAWGLGYFGQPHILARFMAIKRAKDIRPARLIAMVWVVISLFAAVFVGLVGQAYFAGSPLSNSETVFMNMVNSLFNPIVAGVLLTAILAAIMSTADSQLLVTSSVIASDFYKQLFRKKASEKELLLVSRVTILLVSVAAVWMALNPESGIFGIVSYAWAGLGAAFGPVVLLSLFWRRMTRKAAIVGMAAGGILTIVFNKLKFLGGIFGVYEILPAFIIATILIVAVSLLDKQPEQEILDEFDQVKAMSK